MGNGKLPQNFDQNALFLTIYDCFKKDTVCNCQKFVTVYEVILLMAPTKADGFLHSALQCQLFLLFCVYFALL